MASHSSQKATRLCIACLIALAALASGCARFATVDLSGYPSVALPTEMPEGLKIPDPLPDGVRVVSGVDALRIEADREKGADPLAEFFVLLPFGAALEPTLDALSLRVHDGKTTDILDLAQAHAREGLGDAVDKHLWADVSDAGVVRFWRVVRVRLRMGGLRVGALSGDAASVALSFRFGPVEADAARKNLTPSLSKGFEAILGGLVANPDAADLYGSREAVLSEIPDVPWRPDVSEANVRWLKTMVDCDGLVKIAAEDLKTTAGALNGVQVFAEGREVPSLAFAGEGKTWVAFYGRGSESRYSRERAYWLRVPDAGAAEAFPRRMSRTESPGAYPKAIGGNASARFTARFEEDKDLLIQHGNFLSIKGNRWVWSEIASEQPAALHFDLVHLPPDAKGDVEIDVAFHFFSYDDIDASPPPNRPPLVVRINDKFEKRLDPFTDAGDRTRRLSVPISSLRRLGNTMSIGYAKAFTPATPARVYLDYVEARYTGVLIPHEGRMTFETTEGTPWRRMAGFPDEAPILLDITRPAWPSRIETHHLGGHLYGFYESRPRRRLIAVEPRAILRAPGLEPAVDTGIESEENEADYLIVYHKRFEKQVARLAEYHRSRGRLVRAVEIGEVFQKFSMGESTPSAIRDFLRHAVAAWRVPPSHVCLFGDASSDYRGDLRSGVENLLPAYSFTSELGEVWASEHWYSTLAGDDLLPDVILGRISARLEADADEMVRKAIEVDGNAPMGPWRGRIAFVADDSGFRRATDMVRTTLTPPQLEPDRIYVEEASYEDNFYVPEAIARAQNLKVATGATLDMLKTLNRGVSMLIFFGHGSPNIWCDERVWFGGDSPNSDNLNLRNGDRLPFVATFTCNHGAFDYPMPAWHICVSEDMMRVPRGGAAALYVPSGPGLTAVHRQIARALMQAVFTRGMRTTGEAVTLSKLLYVLRDTELEAIRMFLLLGDPAMRLPLPGRLTEGDVLFSGAPLADSPAFYFQAATPPDLRKGRFSAYLYGPDGREKAAALRQKFRGGVIQWPIVFPVDAQSGVWTVRAYYGAPSGGNDGMAAARFLLGRPDAAANDVPTTTTALPDLTAVVDAVPFEPTEPLEGHTVYLRARLENRGGADSPPFRVELWERAAERPPVRLTAIPNLRQEAQGGLASGASREVRLRWDYPAFGGDSGSREIELRIDPDRQVREADESNNVLRVPVRIRRKAKVEVLEARQPGRELELMSQRTSATTPSNIHLLVTVRNNGEETAYMRKLGVYRREPKTPDEYVDPAIRVEEVALPPLAPGEDKTYEFRWRTTINDAGGGRASAKVYRTLKSVRAAPDDFAQRRREW